MKKISISIFYLLFTFQLFAQNIIKVACLGNSITYGASVENRMKNNYPKQLERKLGAGYEVGNFGVSGATMLKLGDKPYWKEGLFKDAISFEPDIVVIKLGTNDTKPQNWDDYGSYYKEDYISMINKMKSLPSKPTVLICMPVPIYGDRWGIRDSILINNIIPIVKEIAKETGCALIDLFAPMSNHPEYFPDKIHPNAAGATVIAETVFPFVKNIKVQFKK